MIERDEQAVLATAREAGIERMITIGTGRDDHGKIVDMVERLKPWVYGTLGFSPSRCQRLWCPLKKRLCARI